MSDLDLLKTVQTVLDTHEKEVSHLMCQNAAQRELVKAICRTLIAEIGDICLESALNTARRARYVMRSMKERIKELEEKLKELEDA